MSMTIGPKFPQPPVMTPGMEFAGEATGKKSALFSGESVLFSAGKTSGTESVDPAVEADITRSDQIGRWCKDAFTLPPPPMPPELKS